MNTADIAVVVIVVLCGIIALRLGLVRVVLGLAGWVGATLATIYGYSHARPYAREWIGHELIADIAAGAAIFVVTMIILTFVSHAIAGGVRDSAFGMLDRTFGLLASHRQPLPVPIPTPARRATNESTRASTSTPPAINASFVA